MCCVEGTTQYRPLASLALQDASSITATLKDLNVKSSGHEPLTQSFAKSPSRFKEFLGKPYCGGRGIEFFKEPMFEKLQSTKAPLRQGHH